MIVGRAAAAALLCIAPTFALAHLFHSTTEPPLTQLSRDYAVIRVLLIDSRDLFEQIRGVYDGTIRVASPVRSRAWLARRPEHIMVFRGALQRAWSSGTLRRYVQRVDKMRGSSLGSEIERSLAARDREGIERGFREFFTVLVDDLLSTVADRADDTLAADRLYQHARRYYSDALEAHLALNAPAASSLAGAALNGMARALGNTKSGAPAAPEAFEKQRRRFMRAVTAHASE
jgi:hypothetical protein